MQSCSRRARAEAGSSHNSSMDPSTRKVDHAASRVGYPARPGSSSPATVRINDGEELRDGRRQRQRRNATRSQVRGVVNSIRRPRIAGMVMITHDRRYQVRRGRDRITDRLSAYSTSSQGSVSNTVQQSTGNVNSQDRTDPTAHFPPTSISRRAAPTNICARVCNYHALPGGIDSIVAPSDDATRLNVDSSY